MQPIFSLAKTVAAHVRRDMRVRWGLGAGASVLLSAGVLGLGGSFTPEFLHASASAGRSVIPQERIEHRGIEIVDMSTSTVYQIIESLPRAERFEMMLYNSGADEVLRQRGTYTVFVPSSADFDYLPARYLASLSRNELHTLALGHITSRALPVAESLNGDVITLGNTRVSFEVDAASDTVTIGGAKSAKAYIGSNGMVYIINKVLADAN